MRPALPKQSLRAQKLKHTFLQFLIAKAAKAINKSLKELGLPTVHHSTFTLAAF